MQYHSQETRARVIAMWQLGTPAARIARELGIPRSTVRAFVAHVAAPVVASEKREDIGELVYDLIAELAKGARAIAKQLQDPGWLQKQSGSDIAISLGVSIDKMAGLIGAIERGRQTYDAGPPAIDAPSTQAEEVYR